MKMSDVRINEKRKTEAVSSLLNISADTINELHTMRSANLSQQEELRQMEMENISLTQIIQTLKILHQSTTFKLATVRKD